MLSFFLKTARNSRYSTKINYDPPPFQLYGDVSNNNTYSARLCLSYFYPEEGSSSTRGGIQRAPKVSIEWRLLGFLANLPNESTVLPGFSQETQVDEV